MHSNERSVDFWRFCPELVWREGLLIAAAWCSLLLFPLIPQSRLEAGQVFATVLTVLLTARASWKAGFTSIMLVLMGLVALSFGDLFGTIFFVCAAGGAVCTLVSTAYRRAGARDAARQAKDAAARRRLQSMREGELSVGAALRQGHAVNCAPAALGRSLAPSASAASPRAHASTSTRFSAAESYESGLSLIGTAALISLAASAPVSPSPLSGSCSPEAPSDASSSLGGSGCSASFE